MIAPEELASLQAEMRSILTDTCDLHSSGSGRPLASSGAPCRVTPARALGYGPNQDRPEVAGTWLIRLPAGTDVSPEWQVRMSPTTRTPGLQSRVFTVTGDLAGSDELVRRVLAVEGQ